MPTYQELASEPEWGAQFVPPVMNAGLLGPLRVFYGLGPSAVGSAGDNNHLYGRHRSYSWDRNSRYCTNRGYGTTDPRDQPGNRNWYRAVDVGIKGPDLFAASRRMDDLVRSGKCPGLAEWFGTFNGVNVVGWFEGRPTTADASHLSHLHVGVWNGFANDAETMQIIYGAITGTADPIGDDDMAGLFLIHVNSGNAPDPGAYYLIRPGVGPYPTTREYLNNINVVNGWKDFAKLPVQETADSKIYGPLNTDVPWPGGEGGSGATVAQIADGVANKLSERLEK